MNSKSNDVATILAVVSIKGKVSEYLVELLCKVNMYLFPEIVTDNGPTISISRTSKACVDVLVIVIVCRGLTLTDFSR